MKNIVAYPCLPTLGRKTAAMVVDTAWLMRRAMLMTLERMRVGISSDKASQTHTPGPTAKNAMKQKMQAAVSQPVRSVGTGVMSALSIFSGAILDFSRLANGFWKNAATLFGGRHPSRLISIFAPGSSERTTFDAAVKSP